MASCGKMEEYTGSKEFFYYIDRLEFFFTANGIENASVNAGRRKVILLNLIGKKIYGLARDLLALDRLTDKTYSEIVEVLKNCQAVYILFMDQENWRTGLKLCSGPQTFVRRVQFQCNSRDNDTKQNFVWNKCGKHTEIIIVLEWLDIYESFLNSSSDRGHSEIYRRFECWNSTKEKKTGRVVYGQADKKWSGK